MDPNAFMMAGGMQMQQPPRLPPGNDQDAMLARILEEVRKTPLQPGSWQAAFEPRTRAVCVANLVKALRMLHNNANIMQALEMALRFENNILLSSNSQEEWMNGIKAKLQEITQAAGRRMAQQQQQQQQQQNAQMAMPMQASRSQQGEMAPQAPMPPQMMGQMNMQQQPAQQFSPEEQRQITIYARQMLGNVAKEQADMLRQRLLQQMGPQQREAVQRSNQDPLHRHFQQLAIKKLQQERMKKQQQMGGQSIDFSAFAGQQADAMKMAENGQLVVPASNNNMGMDASAQNMANMQMNMQQPAMANNQQIQNMMAARQQQTQNQMRNSHLQQQQAHAQAQARSAAQQQAAAQQQMLRGQPGGLNTTQPPQQSPAMSMLNRPMAPPGQPSQTPPQPRPQPTPQPGQQMNPQMMAQFGQQGVNNQNLFPPQKPGMQIPPEFNVPPAMKAKLETLPVEQQRLILEKLRAQQQNQAGGQQAMMPGMPPGAPMGQQPMPNAMGMPPQGPMNPQQMAMGMQGMNQQQIQQRLLMQRQREWDAREFPRKILNDLCQVPPSITTWGQLKQFVNDNAQGLDPSIPEKVRRLQSIIIQKQLAQARQGGPPQMQGQPPNVPNPNQPMMPGSQAPPAPMVPQPPQMPPNPAMTNMNMAPNPPNMANPAIPQVTDQEIAMFRQRFSQGQNMTNDQIRQAVTRIKIQQLQKNNPALVEQMRQASIQRQQPPLNLTMPPQNRAPQVPQMAPQAPSMQPHPSQQFGGMPQNLQMDQKGQKRPGPSDDVVEIPNPNQSPQRPPTANGQQNRPQQKPQIQLNPEQLKNMHPDQLRAMPPEQRAKIQMAMQHMQQKMQREALRRAQSQTGSSLHATQQGQQPPQSQPPQQGQQPSQAPLQGQAPQQPSQNVAATRQMIAQQQRQRLIMIIQETEAMYRKGPPREFDEASMAEAFNKLQSIQSLIPKMEKMLPAAMGFANEQIIRQMCLHRAKFLGDMSHDGQLNGYISLPIQQLNEIENSVRNFILQCIKHVQQQKTKQSPDQVQQNLPPQAKQPPSMAASAMVRSGSKSGGDRSKPPPAPTSTVPPPFPVSHPSPHGVPVYDGSVQGLTPDKLHLPAPKRRKTGQNGSSASTPANQGATPGSMPSPNIKMQSPEAIKRVQPPKIEQPREPERKFKCLDEYCEFNVRGFEKEEQLQAHTAEAHKKIEDPLEFFLQNTAAAMDVDQDGNDKTPRVDGAKQLSAATGKTTLGPAAVKKEALKAEGQTPGRTKAATPSPFVKPGTPPTIGRTPQGAKVQQAQAGAQASASPKKKTMLETMAEKVGINLPASSPKEEPQSRKRKSPSPDPAALDDNFIKSLRDTLDTMDDGVNFTDMDWGFEPSPTLTPSSSNSTTTAATDISEHDRLKIMFESDPFGLGSGVKWDFGDDLGLGVEGEEKREKDVSWEAMFGPNAGLDKDETNWNLDENGNSIFEGVVFFDA